MEHYFNTNNETTTILRKSNEKAKSQEYTVLMFFEELKKPLTPEYFENFLTKTPITSIRRAFSNLADPKKWNAIEKTGEMIKGRYGKKIHTWRLK